MDFIWNFLGLAILAQEGQRGFLLGDGSCSEYGTSWGESQGGNSCSPLLSGHEEPRKLMAKEVHLHKEASPVFSYNWVKGSGVSLVTKAR